MGLTDPVTDLEFVARMWADDGASRGLGMELTELVHDETRLLAQAALLADLLALDRWRVLAFTYAWACLNTSFWLPLGGSYIVRWFLKVAEIIEPHIEPLLA